MFRNFGDDWLAEVETGRTGKNNTPEQTGGCHLVDKYLPSIHKVLASIPGTINKLTRSLWLDIVVVCTYASRTQKTESERLRV